MFHVHITFHRQLSLGKLRQNREALTSSQQAMEESGAILNQISDLKDSLDQVLLQLDASAHHHHLLPIVFV